jgi:hypothetical protein
MQVTTMNQNLSSHQLATGRMHPARMNRPGNLANQPAPVVNDPAATTTDSANAVTESRPANESPALHPRHQRRHVQQYLRHLVRIVRHEIRQELKEAEALDPDTSHRIKELEKDFRNQLRDTFLAAGRGHDFDPTAIISGLNEAVTSLTEGLRELNGHRMTTEASPPPNSYNDETVAPAVPDNEPAVQPYAPVADPRHSPASILSLEA